MALPNMAMIPSGYKPTKLYSVLPTPSYGSELVTNGDFSNGSTDWTLGSGWSVSNGKAVALVGSAGLIQSGLSIVSGKTYKVTFDVILNSGTLLYDLGDAPSKSLTQSGSVNVTFVSQSTTNLRFFGTTFVGSIDNVSVKEVLVGNADFDVTRATPATRVNQQGLIETPEFIESGELITNGNFSNGGTDWFINNAAGASTNITNGVCNIFTSGNFTSLNQSNVMIAGKQYKITLDVIATNGAKLANSSSSFIYDTSTVGNKVFYLTADATSLVLKRYIAGVTDVTIDNISVIQVERNNIPRLDYTDGTCPVLLTEPQSTNLVTESEDFSDSVWIKSNVSLTSNSIISPDGNVNAAKLIASNVTGEHQIKTPISLSTNQNISLFAKKAGYNFLIFRQSTSDYGYKNVCFDLLNGQLGTIQDGYSNVKIDDYGNDWYRCSFTITNRNANNIQILVAEQDNVPSFLGDGTSGLYIWGAQVEQLSYPTSYIPTYGGTVTRNQDIVNNAGTSATYNSAEGVLFVDVAALVADGADDRFISISDGTTDNQVSIYLNDLPGKISALISSNNVDAFLNSTGHNQLNFNKIALKYKSNDIDLWINGLNTATVTTQNAPIGLSRLNLSAATGGKYFYGKTSQVQVFNTALSDFDLQNLTSNATSYASYEIMRTSLNFNIQ